MDDPVKKAMEKRRADREKLQRARERVRAAKDAKRADLERERKARDAERKAEREKETQAEAVDASDTGGAEEVSMAMTQIRAMRHYLDGIETRIQSEGDMEEWYQNKLTKANDYLKTLYGYGTGKSVKESLEEAKLYHKDFSSAMAQAYDHAKKKLGVTIDPKEIDSKVAQGAKKPSKGKTNRYQLKGKGGTVQVQVYNTGKSYELNVYKEDMNEASYTKNTKDSQLKWGRNYILNTDSNNSVTSMLTQMKAAMKRASMRHPKLGAGTEVKTKKGSLLIVPETAELYLKSRDRLPGPLQKNMDKMAERSPDGLFTVLQAALNDLRSGLIENMTEVLKNINEAKMHYVIYDKKTKEVYASSSKPFDKFKMDDVADDMKVKKSDLVMKKMRKSQKAGERLKEASETITEADSLYLIYKDKMKAKKVAAHIKARFKKMDVNLAPMDARNMGITIFGAGAEKVKADIMKKFGKPDDFMMEEFSDFQVDEIL